MSRGAAAQKPLSAPVWCRCRIFRQPQGHLLLIGVSGAGKTTLSRFVAWMNGLSVYQIKVGRFLPTPAGGLDSCAWPPDWKAPNPPAASAGAQEVHGGGLR